MRALLPSQPLQSGGSRFVARFPERNPQLEMFRQVNCRQAIKIVRVVAGDFSKYRYVARDDRLTLHGGFYQRQAKAFPSLGTSRHEQAA